MNKIKYLFNRIPQPLKNKYLITIAVFVLWIIFIDDYNLLKQNRIQKKITDLTHQKKFYISEIKKDSIELLELKTNPKRQEEVAREKFLMKKDDEDVFIIRKK